MKEVYLQVSTFPKEEKFGLSNQIKKSAVSIPSNIAEGCGRESTKELNYFLNVAIGSSCELETQLYLAFDLEFMKLPEMENLAKDIIKIRKMIIAFQKSIKVNS